ncbi:MAG: cation transporter [Proteobacteria bacterium]|nr:cation transporter [Pseudomonadota bacterium]
MNSANPKQEATRVTLVGMWLDLLLGFGKIAGGAMTQSFALIADGIHSLADAITDIFVLIVARSAQAAPDGEYPYAQGRFETLGTIGMGIGFITIAGILLFDSYQRLLDSEISPVPAIGGIVIALISIASKEWIYQYTMRVAKRLNSNLLKANAWHSRGDTISSVAVLIGIVAARQGYVWMDIVAAMFVALIIARIGWELCSDAVKELVDTAMPVQRRAQIEACILATQGIRGMTKLRSRLSAGKIILEVSLLVNPRISVAEGHRLGEAVSSALIGNFSDIVAVKAHIELKNHGQQQPSCQRIQELPERTEVIANIKRQWQEILGADDIESMDLHYREHGIEVDLTVTLDAVSELLASQLKQSIGSLDYVAKLRIYSKLHELKLDRRQS